MFALFALGTLGFWIVISLFVIACISFVEFDNGPATGFTLVAGILFLALIVKIPLITFILTNPLISALCLFGYIIAGSLWSLLKWYELSNSKVAKFNADVEKEPALKVSEYKIDCLRDELNPVNNKSTITFWLTYWPFSLSWACINQPVKRTYRFVYLQLEHAYNRISNSALNKANFGA